MLSRLLFVLHNNSSSIRKTTKLCPLDDLESKDARLCGHKLYPAPAAGTGFTICIYTKSAHLPSRKIPQITEAFSIPSNRINNCKLEHSASRSDIEDPASFDGAEKRLWLKQLSIKKELVPNQSVQAPK